MNAYFGGSSLPSLESVTLGIDHFVETLTSSPYDLGTTSGILSKLVWSENLSENTDIYFQMRSTTDVSGFPSDENWTSWVGPDGTENTYFTDHTGSSENIPDLLIQGENDQWIQYKAYLKGKSGVSPILDDIDLIYVINAQPQVSSVTASQDEHGTINATYQVSDEDGANDSYTAYISAYLNSALDETLTMDDETAISVTNIANLPSSGIILIDSEMISYASKDTSQNILTGFTRNVNGTTRKAHSQSAEIYIVGSRTTGTGSISAVTSSPSEKSITWDVRQDVPGVYLSNAAKIKVSVNDGNGAFQLGSGVSSPLEFFDTKPPAVASITVDGMASDNNISLSVTDDNSNFQMKYSTNQSDLDNDVITPYQAYSATATVNLNSKNAVYFRFKDWKENITNYTVTIPEKIQYILVQDISNIDSGQYRLFMFFSSISEPANGFDKYHIYAADSADGSFAEIATLDSRANNYYMDENLSSDQQRYYKVFSTDKAGSRSEFSAVASGTADGHENSGEGNTGDKIPPVIAHNSASQIANITDHGATIFFTADKASDSAILFSIDASYNKEQGIPTFIPAGETHSVNLVGLQENTTYYYKIISRDALGNIGELENQDAQYFTTTTDTTAPQIQNIVTAPADDNCVIKFDTTKPSKIRIDYGADGSYGQSLVDDHLNLDHNLTISHLTPDTVYHFRITATDDTLSRNQAESSDLDFTTVTLPVITFAGTSGITDVTATRATISFTTNKEANSLIDYSTTAGVFTSTQGNYTDDSTAHAVTLTGLNPETVYFFQIRSDDSQGKEATDNNGLQGYSFTTLPSSDKDAPAISDVRVSHLLNNSATVTWTTDQSASSLVDLGTSLAFGKTQGDAVNLVTSHTVVLSGLSPATTYLFRVKSADENGNFRTEDNGSRGFSFTTAAAEQGEDDTAAPVITFGEGTGITNITQTSAVVAWTTDEDADSTVQYGINGSFSQEAGSSILAKSHRVVLSGLSPASAYRFVLRSQDAHGNLATEDNGSQGFAFTTLSGSDQTPPVIAEVKIASVSGSGVSITWNTDENASSVVEYGSQPGDFSSVAGSYATLSSSHVVIISGLSSLTTYYFRVSSEDQSKNMASDDGGGAPYVFTTLAKEDTCPVSFGGGSTRDQTAPQISDLNLANVTSTSATLTWHTGEAGYSLVEYGPSNDYGNIFGSKMDYKQEHAVSVPWLKSATTYHARVLSADASGNLGQSAALTFTTLPASSETAPEQEENTPGKENPTGPGEQPGQAAQKEMEDSIRRLMQAGMSEEDIQAVVASAARPLKITSDVPKVSDLTNSSVRISWMTDKRSNSIVRFRVKGDGSDRESGTFSELVSDHSVTLLGLGSGVVYEYQVQSSDVLGNTSQSAWQTFTTGIIPSIYDVTVSDINLSAATLEWKTNVASSSELQYGTTVTYGETYQGKTEEKSTAHIVRLNNLQSGRVYHYRIRGLDGGGNLLASDDYTFTTYTLPQVVDYSILSVGEREASIAWNTNVETDSMVKYTDPDSKTVATQGEDALVKEHSFKLKNLSPGKKYLVQIYGRDTYGNQALSAQFGLQTPFDVTPSQFGRMNVETAVSAGKSSSVRTIISYTTNEPATTQILYANGAGGADLSQSTPLDGNLTTNHVIVITDFKPASVYRFQAEARDAAGNAAVSQTYTVLVPAEKKSVLQMITQNFENTFGWLKKLQKQQ